MLEVFIGNFPALAPVMANESPFPLKQIFTWHPSLSATLNLMKSGGWRYGFSSRKWFWTLFEKRDAYAQRFQNIDLVNFAEATKEAKSSRPKWMRPGIPFSGSMRTNLTKVLANHREPLSRLRLLRAATTLLATGQMPKLADPFGSDLLFSREPGKVKIWSVGSDGENQEGRGSWKLVPGQDLVLEISK